MKLEKNYLTKNRCYTNAIKINVKGIMVHSTGVSQSNVSGFLKNWNTASSSKCVHAFVTEDKVIQTLPWNYKGWHAGGSANKTHIGFEILEPSGFKYSGGATMVGYDVKKNQEYFNKVYKSAVELCAMLCKKYGLNPMKDILCHSEGHKKGIASNHADVMHWFPKHGKDMDDFRADVKKAMAAGTTTAPAATTDEEQTKETITYRVQLGAFSKKENAAAYQKEAKAAGIATTMVSLEGNYVVQVGVYTKKEDAKAMQTEVKKKGFVSAVVEVKSKSSTTTISTGYKVKITASILNVRKGPGTSYGIATKVKKNGIYTIVQTKNGWGKLKSGAGWISLSYTKKV